MASFVSSAAVLETRQLRKSFRSRKREVEAVRGVDLELARGEIFGFLGPNGAGKTTTLRMLTTLLQPSSGSAAIDGFDLVRQPSEVRRRIGYVSQAGGAEASASGSENLVLQARLHGMPKSQAQARAAELLTVMELQQAGGRPASTYSGGQRRRLDLALGMVHRPALLFLDEPTTGLDPQSRARLWDEVRRLRDGGTTVFLTTHYLEEADALCDRLAIIDGGLIVAAGTPEALKQQVSGDVVTLGLDSAGQLGRAGELLRAEPYVRELSADDTMLRLYVARGEEALPRILRTVDGAGIGVRTIALARPTLDDVFLRQTGRSLRESMRE